MAVSFGAQRSGRLRMSLYNSLSIWSLSLVLLGCMPVFIIAQSAADYYVHSLPGAPDGPLLKMHAGHVEVDSEHNGHLFFWHFQSHHIANRQRTVIWLNGGPGCSSMDGALLEIGPYRLRDDHSLQYNNGSWDEFANLLFVDQPVGTGFSFVDTNSHLRELTELADQFILFLDKWFKLFPEYEVDDIYIAGESYAGQYIPYITQAILERNKKIPGDGVQWNVQGLLIGSGWISPVDQYPSYLGFMYKEALISKGDETSQRLESEQSACLSSLNTADGANRIYVESCESILSDFLSMTQTSDHQCYNMYDVRLWDSYPSCGMNWPPDLVDVKPYLRRKDVVQALNINSGKTTGWEECAGAVSGTFKPERSVPSIQLLPGLLESGIPVLLFNGDKDLICNHVGTEQTIHNMKWNDGTGFETSPGVWAPRRDWTFEGEPAGYYQQARNLTYVLFYNASHMVPFDWSRRTRDMLDRFMHVDIANIGGPPTDSRIDGEKLPQTSVGGHPNSTIAEEQEKEKLKNAEWKAYAKSGEAVLVIVVTGFSVWGFFIWRSRRRRRLAGYRSLYENGNGNALDDGDHSGCALERFPHKKSANSCSDLEAADFNEAELERLNLGANASNHHDQSSVAPVAAPLFSSDLEREDYAVGDDSDDDVENDGGRGSSGDNGSTRRSGVSNHTGKVR